MKAILTTVLLIMACVGCAHESIHTGPVCETDAPVVTMALSSADARLAYVVRRGGKHVLRLRRIAANNTEEKTVDTARRISDVGFLRGGRLCYVNAEDGITVVDIQDISRQPVFRGTHPIGSPDGGQVLFMRDEALWIRNLQNKNEKRISHDDQVFVPCSWLNRNEILACRDGSVWRISLNGRRRILAKGNPFAPWYVRAFPAPDGQRVLLISDDTKADVGAGRRSIWIHDLEKGKTSKISAAPAAYWLDARRLVLLSGNAQNVMDIQTRSATSFLEEGQTPEAVACDSGIVVGAMPQLDEDGLYAGSRILLLSP